MALKPETTQMGSPGNDECSYPFGLMITLMDEQLEKAGMDCSDQDCQPGNYVELHVLAEIKGVHKTEAGNILNLQITHIENAEADEDAIEAA